MNLPDLNKMYKEYNKKYFDSKLPQDTKVKWSKQLKTCAGNCYPLGKEIKLAVFYAEQYPNEIKNVLIHEMIHLIDRTHGKTFKSEMERINKLDKSIYIKLTAPYTPKITRYIYRCSECGFNFIYTEAQSIAPKCKCGKYTQLAS
jgi:predicted SprT family Zn-dependent metalloprotease